MRLLRVPLQYPRKASALEPRGSEVAGTTPISEGMEESSVVGGTWELRGGVVWSGVQAGWYPPWNTEKSWFAANLVSKLLASSDLLHERVKKSQESLGDYG